MSNPELEQILESLRDKIPTLRGHRQHINEANTIALLIDPLLKILGWEMQPDSYLKEYRHKQNDNPVDCALFLGGNPVLFVEAKALGKNLDDHKHLTQTLNYANAAGVRWCALTNGAEWRVYNVHAQVPAEKKLFFKVSIDQDSNLKEVAAKLLLIGRDGMSQKIIDLHWEQWLIDRNVREVIRSLCKNGDKALVSKVKKQVDGFKPLQIKEALSRVAKDMQFPDTGVLSGIITGSGDLTVQPSVATATQSEKVSSSKPQNKKNLPSTKDMFRQGLLRPGMVLRIKNKPGSEATVVDENNVRFNNELVSYHRWGCVVMGYAVAIYRKAETEDGKLLNDLRDEMN